MACYVRTREVKGSRVAGCQPESNKVDGDGDMWRPEYRVDVEMSSQ